LFLAEVMVVSCPHIVSSFWCSIISLAHLT
jgi:hypothetical protein